MRVLVVGGGGREHALIWKIRQSPYIEEIFCAPGNGGIESIATCVDIEVDDIKGLIQFAEDNVIDLTVIGPELPLTLGIVDHFQKADLAVFGPTKKAAELEGSKVYAKEFMAKHNIPSGGYKSFKSAKEAIRYVHTIDPPFVIKADGLAAGKGVIICQNRGEGFDAIEKIMKKKAFGKSGSRIVIEEFLEGEEVSVLAITDGERYVLLPPAQDHKAAYEGDTGPNTGGMGAYAPAPVLSEKDLKFVELNVIKPVIKGMKSEGRLYKGVLYAGIILTKDGPKVLEFNCRFGDPEIQAILPLLKTDILDLMMESAEGRLKNQPPLIEDKAAVCVVMASGGYPESYEKGKEIKGLKSVPKDVFVFHAGTKKRGNQVVTSGGRVLGVTAMSDNIQKAINKVYSAVSQITYDRAFYRGDIAHRAIKRL
ncbi:phosphoribosylamine--glycine ligase [candidate division KSB1 bacterium]|nr:phosphoribosylamine--glycine ligase [candidate division KSB1 bacterium]